MGSGALSAPMLDVSVVFGEGTRSLKSLLSKVIERSLEGAVDRQVCSGKTRQQARGGILKLPSEVCSDCSIAELTRNCCSARDPPRDPAGAAIFVASRECIGYKYTNTA